MAVVHFLFPLWWTVELTIRWIHYWKHGAVPLRLDATGKGILITRPGFLRAIKRRYWARADIAQVDMERVSDIFRRRPRVGVRIRNRSNRTLAIVLTRGDEPSAERAASELRRVLGLDVKPEA